MDIARFYEIKLYHANSYYCIVKYVCIGGQRGGAAVPRPPPFRKKWSENAPERVNFSKGAGNSYSCGLL